MKSSTSKQVAVFLATSHTAIAASLFLIFILFSKKFVKTVWTKLINFDNNLN